MSGDGLVEFELGGLVVVELGDVDDDPQLAAGEGEVYPGVVGFGEVVAHFSVPLSQQSGPTPRFTETGSVARGRRAGTGQS